MTRRTFLNLLLLALPLLLTMSCTHNNGDIGPLFGQWKVETIEVDGNVDPDYAGNLFWSFQSGTVEVKAVYNHHEVHQSFGNWSLTDDDRLILSFPDEWWQPPTDSYLPSECTLQVLALSRTKAIFRLPASADTPQITYTLKKW